MAQLTLVRHGQAAAFSEDSDRLTEVGVQQAARLGAHLVSRGHTFDRVIVGSLRRHRQTLEQVALAYAAAGQRLPEPTVDAGWDEYDPAAIMGSLTPVLTARDPEFARAAEAARAALGGPEQNRYFQRVFEVIMHAWAGGEVGDGGCEPFAAFRDRVLQARERARAAGGRRVVVFTSGGPIGLNVADCLGAPSQSAMLVNYRVRNASLTDFLFSGAARLSFDGFNAVPHLLGAPELITYR